MEKLFQPIDGKMSNLIRCMVEGLQKEWVKVNLNTFGKVKEDICVGCAATNTLCELKNEPFTKDIIDYREARAYFLNIDLENLRLFEIGIDELRKGHFMVAFNLLANVINFKNKHQLRVFISDLCEIEIEYGLENNNYKEVLPLWLELADEFEQAGL